MILESLDTKPGRKYQDVTTDITAIASSASAALEERWDQQNPEQLQDWSELCHGLNQVFGASSPWKQCEGMLISASVIDGLLYNIGFGPEIFLGNSNSSQLHYWIAFLCH